MTGAQTSGAPGRERRRARLRTPLVHYKRRAHKRGVRVLAAAAQALVLPKVRSFSSTVWKRPWPNLDDVSMNFS